MGHVEIFVTCGIQTHVFESLSKFQSAIPSSTEFFLPFIMKYSLILSSSDPYMRLSQNFFDYPFLH